jgi:hypothetical protein
MHPSSRSTSARSVKSLERFIAFGPRNATRILVCKSRPRRGSAASTELFNRIGPWRTQERRVRCPLGEEKRTQRLRRASADEPRSIRAGGWRIAGPHALALGAAGADEFERAGSASSSMPSGRWEAWRLPSGPASQRFCHAPSAVGPRRCAARQCRESIVLDAREPGFGASGRNGGQVIPGLKYDPPTLVEMFGEKAGGSLADFAGSANVRPHRALSN